MVTNTKTLITGARGMLGKELIAQLRAAGSGPLVGVGRDECDLEDAHAVDALFTREKPAFVYHVAAKVGGIKANMSDPVGFMIANLKMQMAVFEACIRHRVTKAAFAGSSCVYPRECPQPMKEEYLLTGPLEPTNEGYALAKIAGLRMAAYAHQQHGLLTVCPMFCNLYGPQDTFDLESSHVLSALVRRFSDGKASNASSVTLWGTGSARREFLHVSDAARAMIFLMQHHTNSAHINVGSGSDVSIRDLAQLIARHVGFSGALAWDSSKPDGMPRKCLDVSRMTALGFAPRVSLEEGVDQVIAAYAQQMHPAGSTP